jgi:DNA-binding IclR family transcriptional regulator
VERSLAVLNFMAAHPDDKFTLSELARNLDLNKATLHAILSALADAGYLVRDSAEKSYGLGPALIAVGNAAVSAFPVVDYAVPEMQALTDDLGLMCVASAAIHGEIVILARTGMPRPFGVYVQPGQRLPLIPPLGAVFVAWQGEREIERWFARLGPKATKEDVDHNREALAAVKARGYSVGMEGGGGADRSSSARRARTLTLEEGVRTIRVEEYAPIELDPQATYRLNHVGAPVFAPDGGVALALFLIGFPGPTPGGQVEQLADRLVTAAARVTKEIHGRPPED